jgi:hypothetical protein
VVSIFADGVTDHADRGGAAGDGEVCPLGWHPGQATLRPALALVGRL